VVVIKAVMGDGVGMVHSCARFKTDSAITVAPDRGPGHCHEEFASLARPKWAGDTVSEIDSEIGRTLFEIRDYGFKGRKIAVNV
jgi:hypothetical protein